MKDEINRNQLKSTNNQQKAKQISTNISTKIKENHRKSIKTTKINKNQSTLIQNQR